MDGCPQDTYIHGLRLEGYTYTYLRESLGRVPEAVFFCGVRTDQKDALIYGAKLAKTQARLGFDQRKMKQREYERDSLATCLEGR